MNFKVTQKANFFVKTLVKILIYRPVNCVFSSRFAANFIFFRCFKRQSIKSLAHLARGGRNGKAVSRGVKLFTCLPATLLLSACSFGPIAAPEVSHYFLQGAPADMHHIISAKHVSILVAPIVSAPGYETSAMHYVLTPYQLQSFVKHAWVSPPAQLWQPVVEAALRKAGVGVVVQSPSPVNTDYRLQIALNQFEQNFQKPQSVFQMNASVQLQNVKTGNVIGESSFDVHIPTQANTPYAGVIAANKAISLMDKKIINLLTKHLLSTKTS